MLLHPCGSRRPVIPGISTECVPRRLKGKCVASCITAIPVAAVSAPRSQQTNNWTLGISYDGSAARLPSILIMLAMLDLFF